MGAGADMLLKELQYILAIEKYGNITRAAEHLYISQPALSKYIKNLEETLNVKILEPSGRNILLTDAGKHYVQAARDMIAIYEDMTRDLLSSDDTIRGMLRVGTTFMRSPLLFPEVLARFQKKYPNVEVTLFEENSDHLESQLAGGLIDLVIAKGPVNSIYKFTVQPLFEEEFLLALPKTHPSVEDALPQENGGRAWLDLDELSGERFILLNPGHHTRFMSDQLFAQHKFSPSRTLLTANIETAIRMAAKGLGATFVPEFFATSDTVRQMDLRFFSVGPKYPIRTYTAFNMMRRHDAHLTRYAKDFIQIMQDYCGELFPKE